MRRRSFSRWATLAAVGFAACADQSRGPTGASPGRIGTPVGEIAVGASHSCLVVGRGDGPGPNLKTIEGPAWCWGRNDQGQLGSGTKGPEEVQLLPAVVTGSIAFTDLTAGRDFTCGLTTTNDVHCWGAERLGFDPAPRVVSQGIPFVSVTAGDAHVCGATPDGEVYCWGENDHGQLGDGTREAQRVPVQVAGLTAFAVSAGGRHTCAVGMDGLAYCWGYNSHGQAGPQSVGADLFTPTRVASSVRLETITAGGHHTCGMTPDVQVGGKPAVCWGADDTGQLGRITAERFSPEPGEVGGQLAFREVSAGSRHTCGVVHNLEFTMSQVPNNIPYCWGDNRHGQAGTGPSTVLSVPDSLNVNFGVERLAPGDRHTCAISGGGALCWGDNTFGQLGDGTTNSTRIPTPVRLNER